MRLENIYALFPRPNDLNSFRNEVQNYSNSLAQLPPVAELVTCNQGDCRQVAMNLSDCNKNLSLKPNVVWSKKMVSYQLQGLDWGISEWGQSKSLIFQVWEVISFDFCKVIFKTKIVFLDFLDD